MNIMHTYIFTPRTSDDDDVDDDDDDNNGRVRAEKLLGSARRTMRYFAHNVPLPPTTTRHQTTGSPSTAIETE